MFVFVAGAGSADALLARAQAEVRALDPAVPISEATTPDDVVSASLHR